MDVSYPLLSDRHVRSLHAGRPISTAINSALASRAARNCPSDGNGAPQRLQAMMTAAIARDGKMITKFDSSYYGTADMENRGYTGTPINDRRYSKEQLAKAMHKTVDYAKCM